MSKLAAAFRSGTKAAPQTAQVERARAAVREHERRVNAATQAIDAAEGELGEALTSSRATWARDAEARADAVRAEAGENLGALRVALDELAELRGLHSWLVDEQGLNDGRPMRTRGLLDAPSSARAMANSAPASAASILAWAAELIDRPQKPPPAAGVLPLGTPAMSASSAAALRERADVAS